MIRDLAAAIILDGKVHSDWSKVSYCVHIITICQIPNLIHEVHMVLIDYR